MKNLDSRDNLVERRAELMAELFFQELRPAFVARSASDYPFDFLIGFANPRGGINLAAVAVKPTERPVPDHFPFPKRLYNRWAHTNIPVLVLVVDVKQNRLFSLWPNRDTSAKAGSASTVTAQLTEIDERERAELLGRLAG